MYFFINLCFSELGHEMTKCCLPCPQLVLENWYAITRFYSHIATVYRYSAKAKGCDSEAPLLLFDDIHDSDNRNTMVHDCLGLLYA